MDKNIVSQKEVEVKLARECCVCHEPIFREGFCWEHFLEDKIAEWDAQDAEREICLEGVGYVFGDAWDPALDGAWHGYPAEEVCR